jgi:5-methyltetrahydropteroyltriglutamate--homocysteine methyltransferase
MWKYAQSLTSKPVKGMLTGPYTMVEWSFDEHYPSRRDAVMAMAEVIRQEAEALDKAGAKYIQIDEPAVSTRFEDIALANEAMGVVTKNLKAKTITHICYGDFAPAYDELVKMPVDQFDLEMANSDYDLVEIMKRKGFDAEIGLGVLDVHTHKVETVEEVVRGIKSALEVLPPEKIYVDPDCGLKTRTWDEAAAKIKVMIEAVRRVKAETGIE